MSRIILRFAAMGIVVALVFPGNTDAAIDAFPSDAHLELELLPIWTGLPAPVPASVWLWGPTTIERDALDAAVGDPDSIQAQIVDMHLWGEAMTPAGNIPVHIWKLDDPRSDGQISEKPGVPPNGVIDAPPFDSFFDVFFEMHVDIDGDGLIDEGELVRNDQALRMANDDLSSVPPTPIVDEYEGVNLPLDLFVVDPEGGLGPAHAILVSAVHIPKVPEPATFAIWSLFGLVAAGTSWRRRRSFHTLS